MIPHQIRTFEELNLPQIVAHLCDLNRGLVLVTGATGSGKSTTLAAMIDKINREVPGHILTLEDPIEFSHEHKRCVVNQREVGADTASITRALKSSLRQDPDVVLIGEMRDFETISAALTIAETGHLVLQLYIPTLLSQQLTVLSMFSCAPTQPGAHAVVIHFARSAQSAAPANNNR